MKIINIKTRIILIVGSTSQGKTTLSTRIKEEAPGKAIIISHDEVLSLIDKKQQQSEIDNQFRMTLLRKIVEAVNDLRNDYIILDTLNISNKSLSAFLSVINMFVSGVDNILLLKLNIPESLNLLYAKQHYPKMQNIFKNVYIQRGIYNSAEGSLNSTYDSLVSEEYVIGNEEIQFSFHKR